MLPSATKAKILEFFETEVINKLKDLKSSLKEGDLYNFEKCVEKKLLDCHNFICELLICLASQELLLPLKSDAKKQGCKEFKKRTCLIRLATGKEIRVNNYYIGKVGKDWNQSRHLISTHWKLIHGASPLLYDRIGFCSALGPSYEIANKTLEKFGVDLSTSSVRDITNRFAIYCNEMGEENLVIKPEESVKGKRVVLSLDGGRTKIRSYEKGELIKLNQKGNKIYQAEWMEPKLFVIDILDENKGQVARHELPIYGVRFSEKDIMDQLEKHLIKLKIWEAAQVQIIADGAPWIWNRAKPLLEKLNVSKEKIIETLDYYHAIKYVNELVEYMPKRITKEARTNYLTQFKNYLWKGESKKIIEECNKVYKQKSKLVKRWLTYLDKHTEKTQYADFNENNLMCGSGIVESAIRRVINLRFKNPSTFWEKENVEKLYFLRGALLSGRWDFIFKNIIKTR